MAIFSGLKIDAKTLKALFFAWDQSEEAEQNWSAVVEGTHLNIKELKNKKDKRNLKDTDNHSTDKITRQVKQLCLSEGWKHTCTCNCQKLFCKKTVFIGHNHINNEFAMFCKFILFKLFYMEKIVFS